MMQRRLRQPLLAGPDIAPAPPPPPMEFMAAPAQDASGGFQPDLGPLAQALQQRLSQNANIANRAVDAPMPRKKIPFADMMGMAAGGFANA